MNTRKQPEKGDLVVISDCAAIRWGIFSHFIGKRTYYYHLAWMPKDEEDYKEYKGTTKLLNYIERKPHYLPDDVLDEQSLNKVQTIRNLLKKYDYV